MRVLLLAILPLLAPAPAAASASPGAHARTPSAEDVVRSPSRAYELRLSSSAGGATSEGRLLRVDPERVMDLEAPRELVWSRAFDFAWHEVHVTDAGLVGGVAYSGGGREAWRDSQLIVAIVGASGELLCDERTPRRRGRFLGQPADPKTVGVFVHEDLQRLIVRVADEDPERGRETWWPFELTTGAALARFEPHEALEDNVRLRRVADVQPIPWTSLTLVQWWVAGPQPGVRFAALDRDGAAVWELATPRVYRALPDEAGAPGLTGRPDEELAWRDEIRIDEPRSFSLQLVGEGRRVEFEVRRGELAAAGEPPWEVREVRRLQMAARMPTPVTPKLALPKLGEVLLGNPGAPRNEVFAVQAFTFRDELIEIVRQDGPGQYTAVLLTQDGAPLERVAFPPLDLDGVRSVEWFPLHGRTWLAACVSSGFLRRDRSVSFLLVDALDPRAARYVGGEVQAPGVHDAVPLRDGGFAVLVDGQPDRGEPYVYGFGERLWTIARGEDERLPWTESLALSPSGTLLLLDAHRDEVSFYSQQGYRLPGLVRLREHWDGRPHRPHSLVTCRNGQLLIHDTDGSIRRLSGSGQRRATIQPWRHGLKTRSIVETRCSPQNDIWVATRDDVLRLDQHGRSTGIARRQSVPTGLAHIGAIFIDPRGRICAQDVATGAVHVFDLTGRPLQVCRPDYRAPAWRGTRLTVGPDGSIFATLAPPARGRLGPGSHMAFGPGGEWLGLRDLGSPFVLFVPRSDRRWIRNGSLKLVAESGELVREIERLPGGRMLEGASALAPDGRLAVVNDRQVALYDREGEFQEAFAVALSFAPRALAYAASGWLVASEEGKAHLIRVRDRSVWRFEVADGPGARGVAYGFSPRGDELWAVDRGRRLLHRYALRVPR